MTAIATDPGLRRSSGRAGTVDPVRVTSAATAAGRERRQTRFVAVTAVIASIMVALPLIAALQQVDRSDLRAVPGAVWLSAESRGRVIMAASGAATASVGVDVPGAAEPLDVADTPSQVMVFFRSTGRFSRVDPVSGSIVTSDATASPSTDLRSRLVAAGDRVYLVDPEARNVRASSSLDKEAAVVEIPNGFDSWTGTQDGRLWLLNSASGAVSTIDDTQVTVTIVTEQSARPVLTSNGTDAVVIERATSRVRWLGRNESHSIPLPSGDLIAQEPIRSDGCITVVAGTDGVCLWPGGNADRISLLRPLTPADQLFADGERLVVTTIGAAEMSTRDATGKWDAHQRLEPSTRRLVGAGMPSALLVDDPGSRYAYTLRDDGTLPPLDKLSRQTVLLQSNGGVGQAGFTAGPKSEATAENIGTQPVADTNGVNDPPLAKDDQATTRAGRAVEVDVLANDVDPEGDPLAIAQDLALTAESGGATASVAGGRIVVVPANGYEGLVSFEYVAIDPGELRSEPATLTVKIVPATGNGNPVATGDRAATIEAVPIDLFPLKNDTDPEGDPLVVVSVTPPSHGTTALDGESIRYTPADGYTGADEFRYQINDGYGGTATGKVSVKIDPRPPVNRDPVAVDDRIEIGPGQSRQVDILANDRDPDGDLIRVASLGSNPAVQLTLLPNQSVDIRVKDSAEPAIVRVPYTIEDAAESKGKAEAELVVVVAARPPSNRPPTALDDAVVLSGAKTLSPLDNDSDPDGDTLTITDVALVSGGGSVQRIGARNIRFTPADGATEAVLEYRISDPSGSLDTARIRVQIVPKVATSAPIARDDVATIYPGETARVSVLLNDRHPEGLPFAIFGQPSYSAGSARVVGSTIEFTPPAGAEAPARYTITYTIRDTAGHTASARVLIDLTNKPETNRPPVAVNDQVSVNAGSVVQIPVLSNDSDPDSPEIQLTNVGPASVGTATRSGSAIRYQAPSTPGTATFTYTIADSKGLTSSASVVVQIRASAKEPPLPRDDAASITVGTNRVVEPLINDIDPDGSSAALVLVSVGTVDGVKIDVSRNRVIVEGVTAGNYVVPYVVRDSDRLTARGRIVVTVDPAVNKPPMAVDDVAEVAAGDAVNIPVLTNDRDPEGGLLKVVDASGGASLGALTFSPSGLSFAADIKAAGTATLTYVVEDAEGTSATANVTLTVTACAAARPSLQSDARVTKFGEAVTISLFDNDDVSKGKLTVGDPSDGTVQVVSAADGVVKYTPPAGFNGVVTFPYTVENVCGDRDTANVKVTVNRPPVAADDSKVVEVGRDTSIPVLANDDDPDGDTLVVTSVSGGATHDGTKVFFTAPDAPGIVTLTYSIADIGGLPSSATITIDVTPRANQDPIAVNDGATITSGQSAVKNVVKNDTDPDGDPLTLKAIGDPQPSALGTASFNGNTITFDSASGAVGMVTINYTVTDGRGGSASATFTITIDPPPNNPPIATTDNVGMSPPGGTVDILNNDRDPDGDAIEYVGSSVSAGPCDSSWTGSVLSITIPADFVGTCTIRYQIRDSRGATDFANVNVEVTAPA